MPKSRKSRSKRSAAVKIQRAVRKRRSKRRKKAAKKIQTAIRKRQIKRRSAAKKIQKILRGHIGRVEASRERYYRELDRQVEEDLRTPTPDSLTPPPGWEEDMLEYEISHLEEGRIPGLGRIGRGRKSRRRRRRKKRRTKKHRRRHRTRKRKRRKKKRRTRRRRGGQVCSKPGDHSGHPPCRAGSTATPAHVAKLS